MKREEFIKYIESIGFKYNGSSYRYKEYYIYLFIEYYHFYNGSESIYDIPLNDLTPLLKLIRSIKLKKILYFNIS